MEPLRLSVSLRSRGRGSRGSPPAERGGGACRAALAEVRRRVGTVFQDPGDRLSMPAVREDATVPMATHGLPHALGPCPRSVVLGEGVLGEGVVAADGPTRDLLCDEALMRAHRPEPPSGSDPRSVSPPRA